MPLNVFLGVDRSIIDGGGGCINFGFLIKLYIYIYIYVYNRSRLMGLDYILNIYCYSESHASCEANHQVNKTINARRGVGAWRVVLK